MRTASPSVRTATIATPRNDGNNNSCSRDNTSFTATQCQPYHPHEERIQGDFHTAREEINNYNA
ncbi:hypothetical protein [Streptomyces afghaniensis]|uniref:hypothetical protein n=1 Tax=Streptomyces afghaniensis TaxID=66865 RepID=UPI002787EAA3|nr:hypothetical protein [Streptomyces afghaniensis]MDQ1013482.1 hypothetical protein [Streptomyces afghaniensis]